ncbi:RadC family protein [Staphylococcus pettenkoferi]|uniref:RadC family protein n=1 Tax=Staphylococcus pettenkoferi TaxID=170573 RepID=UPI00227645E1|nr:DNA repair protein RadC [Staphylococcus pettenkoferi]MCY1591568.1 DNA repair protein RadC [Staphylococcus pettenkoferi]MCY1610061.1 DNA repair protein RadC [Staphylococcus pettenkoferi]MCY1624501.1 DNA repair protein RadC [Staphylococcus pettenkoferi]
MKIKELAPTEKPRERLLHYGADKLSHTELLAILLNTGRKGYSSVEIAGELLKQLSINELMEIKGIGMYKAIILKAAFELGERMHSADTSEKFQIKSPEDVARFAMGRMQHLSQEQFVVLYLNAKNMVIKQKEIFRGTLTSSVVHPREVFNEAVKIACNSIVVLHNHPSGDARPSTEDIETTKRLIHCGALLGIELLDHVIIGDNQFTSLVEEGYLEG